MTFPVAGEENQWELMPSQVAQWQELYPDVDVLQECRKAWAWIDANPKRRKKHNGMKKFLVNWLNRAAPTQEVKADWYGHVPHCENRAACVQRVCDEARAARMKV